MRAWAALPYAPVICSLSPYVTAKGPTWCSGEHQNEGPSLSSETRDEKAKDESRGIGKKKCGWGGEVWLGRSGKDCSSRRAANGAYAATEGRTFRNFVPSSICRAYTHHHHRLRDVMVFLRLSTPSLSCLRLVTKPSLFFSHCSIYTGSPASRSPMRFGVAILRLHNRAFCSKASPVPNVLPLETATDEERVPGYKSEHYYPANPGDILKSKYQLDVKIGWGTSSTVWLAHEIRR